MYALLLKLEANRRVRQESIQEKEAVRVIFFIEEVETKSYVLVHLCWSRSGSSTLSRVALFCGDISVTKTRIWLAICLFHRNQKCFKNAHVIFKIAHQGEEGIQTKTVLIRIFAPLFFFFLIGESVCFLLPALPCNPLCTLLPLQVAIALMIT